MICEECGNNVNMGYAEMTGHKPTCSFATLVDKETLAEGEDDFEDFGESEDEDDENNPDGKDTE